jgi:hypothetical protein
MMRNGRLALVAGIAACLFAAGVATAGGLIAPQGSSSLGAGEPTGRASRDGLDVEFWLDRNTVGIGERVRALARVTNHGPTTVQWETNTCVSGPAPMVVRRPGSGVTDRPLGEQRAEFRRQILSGQDVVGGFIDARYAGRDRVACTLPSIVAQFGPGDSHEQLLAWDARESRDHRLAAGTLAVTATFTYWGLGEDGPPGRSDELMASAVLHLTGEGTTGLGLPDYADAALADPEFTAWLMEHPIPTWINTVYNFWPNSEGEYPRMPAYARASAGAVDIGLAVFVGGREGFGMVILDPSTLEVLGHRFE